LFFRGKNGACGVCPFPSNPPSPVSGHGFFLSGIDVPLLSLMVSRFLLGKGIVFFRIPPPSPSNRASCRVRPLLHSPIPFWEIKKNGVFFSSYTPALPVAARALDAVILSFPSLPGLCSTNTPVFFLCSTGRVPPQIFFFSPSVDRHHPCSVFFPPLHDTDGRGLPVSFLLRRYRWSLIVLTSSWKGINLTPFPLCSFTVFSDRWHRWDFSLL